MSWNWSLFAATFVTIFLAELGDKTQFAAIAASAQSRSTLEILLAVVLALSLAGVLGVLFGRALGAVLDPQLLRYLAGALFMAMGLWIVLRGL